MSSNTTITAAILQLQLVSQFIPIVLGSILFIGGTAGNSLNIVTLAFCIHLLVFVYKLLMFSCARHILLSYGERAIFELLDI
jgi:hypothetical protein